jgi:hypothetical protein
MVGGLSSLLLARLKYRDRLLLYLGLFAVMYASLLFLRNKLVYAAFGIPSQQIPWWFYCLNYVVPIPYALFARELLAQDGKSQYRSGSGFRLPLLLLPFP